MSLITTRIVANDAVGNIIQISRLKSKDKNIPTSLNMRVLDNIGSPVFVFYSELNYDEYYLDNSLGWVVVEYDPEYFKVVRSRVRMSDWGKDTSQQSAMISAIQWMAQAIVNELERQGAVAKDYEPKLNEILGSVQANGVKIAQESSFNSKLDKVIELQTKANNNYNDNIEALTSTPVEDMWNNA